MKKNTPKNLEDTLNFIIDGLDEETKECIKEAPSHIFHLNLGMNLRNDLGLWTKSDLYNWFVSELNITHPDDMSGIILTSLKRRLLGEDIKLQEQVKMYLDYWKNYKDDGVCIIVTKDGVKIK